MVTGTNYKECKIEGWYKFFKPNKGNENQLMDNRCCSDEAKNKSGGKGKSFSNYLTNAEFSFPLAKSPQCAVGF